uniref:C2H2-type domain-containing protein n=1 Tax=Hyaloperonospora arabidopsidis (strain Emoy2) TaxID=559515 RepID=M4BLM7_HYAAE
MDRMPLVVSAEVNASFPIKGESTSHGRTSYPPPALRVCRDATRDKNIFRCTFPGCGREFQLKGNLKRHVNIHKGDKKFACKFCDKKFLRKADMEVHYRVHTGEKPYRCKYQVCGKCFARRSDLLSHERTHTGRKPYACAFPGCDRSFARKFDLHKHQRLHEDQARGAPGKAKTKKRKLSPCQADASSRDKSCDCPSDVATPFVGGTTSTSAVLSADVLVAEASAAMKMPISTTGTFLAGRRKTLATAVCLDTPTRPLRYELKCPENHIHSPPACLAALSSLDAFLSQETLDLSRPYSLDAFSSHCPSTTIGTSCCPAHLELRPPRPEGTRASAGLKMVNAPTVVDPLFTATFPSGAAASADNSAFASDDAPAVNTNAANGIAYTDTSLTDLTLCRSLGNSSVDQADSETSLSFLASNADESIMNPNKVLSSSPPDVAPSGISSLSGTRATSQATFANFGDNCLLDPSTSSADNQADAARPAASVAPVKTAYDKTCLSMPMSSLLDYSRHNRTCGHLSIQHGNHRDYVVQNHLVCQDSVKRLGVMQRASANTETNAAATNSVKCTLPKDTHRPGCGHLPVRHNDHIDYVVEDNLICQQASWLEDDNLELLGDDFWDFYGALDAFPTN